MEKTFDWFLPIKKDDGMVLRGLRVGETAPKVRLHFVGDGGEGADISGCTVVSVVIKRSDGAKVVMTLPMSAVLCVEPAVVELAFDDARMTAIPGLCEGVFDIYSDKVRMTSARFRYYVEPAIEVSDDEVAADAEYSMFVGAMSDLAQLHERVSVAEDARNVFEVYNPEKEYVKGNKVAYNGASYVLTSDRAVGTNPTDSEVWLCIARKGDKGDKGENGSQYYTFPEINIENGEKITISFDFESEHDKSDYPGIDEWRMGDMLLSANGKVMKMVDVIRSGREVKWLTVYCVADIGGADVFTADENGNISSANNVASCMAYYIKSIDLENKKIYLSNTKVVPVISTADNTDKSFKTPDYEVGRLFNIINQIHYLMRASIVSVSNNVVTYDGDLGFTEIYEDEEYDGHTFFVPECPNEGVVSISTYCFDVGDGNVTAGKCAVALGRECVSMAYGVSIGKGCRAVYTAASLGEEGDALGQGSFVACVKNKTTPKAYGGSALGIKTISNAHGQSVRGMYNAVDENGEFLDIVGNGTGDDNRSNAYTLDKDGNGRFSGQVYCEGDKRLAEKSVTDKLGAKLSIEPDILYARKDGKLYDSTRNSCNVVEISDSDGIVYDHITPLNHASKLLYDMFNPPFEIPLSTGRIWLKLLMRSNQAVTPTSELYQVKTKSGTALSTISSVATKAMSGSGEWEEVIIPFENYAADAYKATQIHIRLAGYNQNGSDYYDASGKLIGNPYFDIAGWAIFTDEEIFNLYEFYNEMVGIGSASVADLLMRVRELEKSGTSGAMVFKGVVDELPKEANEGDVYKVTSESVETGKLLITVSGVNSIVRNPVWEGFDYTGTQYDIDINAPIYRFMQYAKSGMYSEFGSSFDSFIESSGNKYTIPWIATQGFGDDYDDFLINSNEAFETLFVNGKSLVCYSDDMSYLPESLKQYAIKYPAGTCFVYSEGEWIEL